MLDFLYRILLPTGLMASCVLLLLLVLRPTLRVATARQRKLAFVLAAALFLLPLPAVLGAAANALAPASNGAPVGQTLAAATPTAPIYAAGEALGGALEHTNPSGAQTPLLYANGTGQAAQSAGADTVEETARPSLWARAAALAKSLAAAPLTALAMLYLLGFVATATLFACRYGLFMRRLRANSAAPQSAELAALYSELCGELEIRHPPALRVSGDISTPLLAGLTGPVVVLPENMQQDLQAASFALRHELTHHKHGDVYLKNAVQAVVALYWFNPLCYLLRREVNEACEQACDEAVAERLDSLGRKAYALSLLQCAESRLPYAAAGFASPARRLKKRLAHLMHPAKNRRGAKTALLGGLALVCCLGILMGCTLQAGTQSAGATSETEAEVGSDASAAAIQSTEISMGGLSAAETHKAIVYLRPRGKTFQRPFNTYTAYAEGVDPGTELTPDEVLYLLQVPHEWRNSAYKELVKELRQTGDVLETVGPVSSDFTPLYHGTVDLDATIPCEAINGGTVIAVGDISLGRPNGEDGQYILVQTKDNRADVYILVQGAIVQPGDEINEGDTIAAASPWSFRAAIEYWANARWAYTDAAFMQGYLQDNYESFVGILVHTAAMYDLAAYNAQFYTEGDLEGVQLGDKIKVSTEHGYYWALVESIDENGEVAFTQISSSDALLGSCLLPVQDYTYMGRGLSEGHRGQDFNAPAGTYVYAVADGEVLEAYEHWSWGNTVLIDHGDGLTSRYAHCQDLNVSAGDIVSQGDVIASVGSTGASTGTQLHFEMTLNDELADPMDYLVVP